MITLTDRFLRRMSHVVSALFRCLFLIPIAWLKRLASSRTLVNAIVCLGGAFGSLEKGHSVFIIGIFLREGEFPRQKKLTIPPPQKKAAKLCAIVNW